MKADALEVAVRVLGGRWRAVLICFLLDGPKRFSDLQKDMGITVRLLRANLRVLEEAGLVVRTAYAEVPPRVEYGLTGEGMELRPLINDLYALGQKFRERQKGNAPVPAIPSLAE